MRHLDDPDPLVVATIDSPLGALLIGARRAGVCLLEYTDHGRSDAQIAKIARYFQCAATTGDNSHLRQLRDELTGYFAGRLQTFSVPLIAPGTPFQERVWSALLTIPYGPTLSYEALAEQVGSRGAQRAVGTANGSNRIAIVIPCHRVVNKNGKLGGYGGSLWRKKALLQLESGLPFGAEAE
jgi:AraC family transcriptional regulator of adaptative response/methylated-DNA-[protein]-cysteine methyltransferase